MSNTFITKKIEAVIFDMDGTLLDTLKDIANSMNMALKRIGQPERDFEYMRFSVGYGVEELVRRAMPEGSSEEDVMKCIGIMREIYSVHYKDTSRPYYGITELLDKLTKLKIPIAILSNKPEEFTIKMTKELLGDYKFDVVRGVRNDCPKKPDPAVPLKIAAGWGISPERIAFVGDSAVDMQTANNAGMFAVGVLWGFRPRQEIVSAGAMALISHPIELIKILQFPEK
jgi:phosphoglycolate phosphatase